MLRISIAATLVLGLAMGSGARANNRAQINALRGQIRDLRKLEKDKLRQIDAKYNQMLRKQDRPEDRLEKELARLRQQERSALQNISDAKSRTKIKADFDKLRADMRAKISSMEAQMGKTNQARKAEKAQVQQSFHQRIHGLNAQIRQLEQADRQNRATKTSNNKTTKNNNNKSKNNKTKNNKNKG